MIPAIRALVAVRALKILVSSIWLLAYAIKCLFALAHQALFSEELDVLERTDTLLHLPEAGGWS